MICGFDALNSKGILAMMTTVVCHLALFWMTQTQIPKVDIDKITDEHIGKKVQVKLGVQSVNRSKRAFLILNSQPSYFDKKNFSVVILKEDQQKFAEWEISSEEGAVAMFIDHTLIARGVIVKYKNHYELVIKNVDDLENLDD